MVFPRPIRAALGLAAGLAFLASCSNNGSSPAPLAGTQSIARQASDHGFTLPDGRLSPELSGAGGIVMGPAVKSGGWMSPEVVKLAAAKQLLYVSCFAGNFINIYDQAGTNQKHIGQIVNGLVSPNGLTVDTSGNLWVANEGLNDILVFKPGALTAFKTLQDPLEYPASIFIDTDGTVFVANLTQTSGAAGSISVYLKGVTKGPSYMITDPNFVRGNSVLLDAKHNVYATNNLAPYPTGPGELLFFKAGSHGPGTKMKIAFKYGGDEHFDNKADLVITDLVKPSVDIFEFPNPKARMITQTGEPYRFSFNAAASSFYIANPLNANVEQYQYPMNKLIDTITDGFTSTNQPIGVATSPKGP